MWVAIIILVIWLVFLQNKYNDLADYVNKLDAKIRYMDNNIGIITPSENNEKPKIQPAREVIQSKDVDIPKPEIRPAREIIQPNEADMLNSEININMNDTKNTNADIFAIPQKPLPDIKPNTNSVTVNKKFEDIFMGNIFNKIGAFAILIGIGILVKLMSTYIEFTDVMKISISYIAGLGMIFAGLKIQLNPKTKKFSEVLTGTGFGALLITTYCASSFMKLFNITASTIIASLIVIAIYYLADKQKTASTLVIGLIGGYLNPFYINSNISMDFLFWYLIFLNILSIVFVYRNPDKQPVNIFNLIVTAATVILFNLNGNNYSLLQCLTLWGIYLVYDILMIKKEEVSLGNFKAQTYLNFGILTLLSYILFKDNYMSIGILLAIITFVYAFLGKISINKFPDKENSYLYSSVISVFLATYFLTDGTLRIVLWSVEAVMLVYLALEYKYFRLAKFSFAFLTASFINIFIIPEIFDLKSNFIASINFIPPIVSGFLISNIFKKYNDNDLSNVSKFIAYSLIYTFFVLVCNSFADQGYNSLYIKLISYAIIAFAYSINIYFGISANKGASGFYKELTIWLYALGIILILISEFYISTDLMPIINIRILPYSVLFGYSYFLFKKEKLDVYNLLGITSLYVYAFFEIYNILPDKSTLTSYMIYSSLGLIYSLNLLLIPQKNEVYKTVSTIASLLFTLMLLCNEIFAYSDMFVIFNFRLLTYALSIINLYYLHKKYSLSNSDILKYLMVFLGFSYIHFESVNIVNNYDFLNVKWLITFMWTLYAGIISLIGIFKDKKYLKLSGTWLSIFVIIRLFIFDFAELDMLFKLLGFLTLGIVLMIISYFYNKNQK